MSSVPNLLLLVLAHTCIFSWLRVFVLDKSWSSWFLFIGLLFQEIHVLFPVSWLLQHYLCHFDTLSCNYCFYSILSIGHTVIEGLRKDDSTGQDGLLKKNGDGVLKARNPPVVGPCNPLCAVCEYTWCFTLLPLPVAELNMATPMYLFAMAEWAMLLSRCL